MDLDATAVVSWSARALGLDAGVPAATLESFWSEEAGCYRLFDGGLRPNVSTEVHVLEAILAAPDADEALKRRVWRRTIGLLASRDWHEHYHLSPFFIWEQIVGFGFRHPARLAADPTGVHLEALEQVLAHQAPGGGFRSAYASAPNQEETGLALIALRAALHGLSDGPLRARVAEAAEAARAFLLAERAEGQRAHLDLWTGKALARAAQISEAIVLASLAGWPADGLGRSAAATIAQA
jgi:hypothetical protein